MTACASFRTRKALESTETDDLSAVNAKLYMNKYMHACRRLTNFVKLVLAVAKAADRISKYYVACRPVILTKIYNEVCNNQIY